MLLRPGLGQVKLLGLAVASLGTAGSCTWSMAAPDSYGYNTADRLRPAGARRAAV